MTSPLEVVVVIAAVGGRLFNEAVLFGWGEVTWAGDFAMLVVMLAVLVPLILHVSFTAWKGCRRREAALALEEGFYQRDAEE